MIKKIVATILVILLCFTGCAPATGDPGTPPSENENPGGNETPGEGETPPETEKVLPDYLRELVDFVVQVEEGRDPIVLQLTDTQIIDAAQAPEDSNFSAATQEFWGPDKMEDRCFAYIRETVEATKPDLIILTGDLIYGKYDNAGTSLTSLVHFMESLGVPWAPVFGNHDAESAKGIDWICNQLKNAEHCLFLQRELTGNSNYTVGIAQGYDLLRVFFMLDSNGGSASEASLANGHTKKSVGFGEDQIDWYEDTAYTIAEYSPNTHFSFAFHIQTAAFVDAYAKYGFTNKDTESNPILIDLLDSQEKGDFGYLAADLKSAWDTDGRVWQGIADIGADSVFVGHEHCNSASVVYEGVRFQFGQKSSTYDRYNSIMPDGNFVTGNRSDIETPLIGGTVIPLAAGEGSIKDPYIYYCKNAGGEVDWNAVADMLYAPQIAVGGLQYGSDLSCESKLTVVGQDTEGIGPAYCVTAYGQGKVYVKANLLKGASTFTFSVYLPSPSTAQLSGLGEFAIRVKPDDKEPPIDGKTNGYIDYATDQSNKALKLAFDQWMTFTVDISALGADCTEFAFLIPQGNVVYLKDIVIS